MAGLGRLLKPKTVALVGGDSLNQLVKSCQQMGFEGSIWPVNPKRRQVAGIKCFPSLEELPHAPDAAFLAVNRERTIAAVEQLAEMGAGSAVCYAALFAEHGDAGATFQRRLVKAAGDMPILGPNCFGLINAVDKVALWPDLVGCPPVSEGVAIISQSGNLGLNISWQRRGPAISHLITVGNQAMLGVEDIMDELLADPRVKGIGVLVEGLRHPKRFLAMAGRALAARVPVVALQVGNSAEGAKTARSHTASLAGMADAYRALFRRAGVAPVRTIPELLGTLAVLVGVGPLGGNRIVSMSCSGGEAAHVADLSDGGGLAFPSFSARQSAAVDRILEGRVRVSNPLDYHTFIWDDRSRLEALFGEVMSGPQDVTMLVLDVPESEQDISAYRKTAQAMMAARSVAARPALVASVLAENLPPPLALELAGGGVAAVGGLEEAVAGLEAAVAWGQAVRRPAPVPVAPVPPDPDPDQVNDLDEAAAKTRLQRWGVAVPRGVVATAPGVGAAAEEIGYPVVLKKVGIAHKTERAGVALGLETPGALEAARAEMAQTHRGAFLVEEMVEEAVAELLVSVRRQWPLGWLVTVGAGGVLTELWDDVTCFLAPVDHQQIREGLMGLRVGNLLRGFRGRDAADVEACVEVIGALVEGAVTDGDVVEVEVNPLVAVPGGAVAVDALLTVVK